MWTLLKIVSDWEKYQQDTVKQLGLIGGIEIVWGRGPKSYPCLVTTYCPTSTGRIGLVSAYVYEEDAMMLLEACGKSLLPQKTLDGMPARQTDFNRWTIANILAIVKTLRETKVTNAERYENDLIEALALVDEDVDTRQNNLSGADKSILDRLEPHE